jgi:hypothetical protein
MTAWVPPSTPCVEGVLATVPVRSAGGRPLCLISHPHVCSRRIRTAKRQECSWTEKSESAGPAFLSTAQSRLMSALNAQRADTAIATGKTQVDQIAESAKAAVPGAVQEAIIRHLPNADAATVKAVTDAASASVEGALKPQVAVAHEQMDAGTASS